MPEGKKRKWRVSAYHGGKDWIVAEFPVSHMTVNRLELLLRMLFSKLACLTEAEIVAMHLRRNVKGHRDQIRITWDRSKDPISVKVAGGSSTHLSAEVLRPEDPRYDSQSGCVS